MTEPSKSDILHIDIAGAFRRFPFPVLSVALFTGWLIAVALKPSLARHFLNLSDDIPPMALLAFAFSTTAAFATIRKRTLSWAVQGAAFLGGLAAGYALRSSLGEMILVLLASVCAASLAAGIAARNGARGFWFANVRLAVALALGIAAAGILTIGGAIILSAVATLLSVKTDRVSEILLIALWDFALPAFCLATACFEEEDSPEGTALVRILSVATDVLLVPLMLIFAAVIYVYAARIVALWELPKGQIGWIVPAYLVLGYGVFLLAQGPEPYLARLRALFGRFFIPGTLVPLVLLALAVAVRIEAYGITQDRYLLALMVVGGALLAGAALVRRPFEIRLVPLMGGVLALLGALGPPPVPVGTPRMDETVTTVKPLETESFDFIQGDILRLPTVTVIGSFRLDETDRSRSYGFGSPAFTLRIEGHWLEVSGDGATTRFDLSPLLTMGRPGEKSAPVLGSAEGRKGDLVVGRFERTKGADGPNLQMLWGKVVLY